MRINAKISLTNENSWEYGFYWNEINYKMFTTSREFYKELNLSYYYKAS